MDLGKVSMRLESKSYNVCMYSSTVRLTNRHTRLASQLAVSARFCVHTSQISNNGELCLDRVKQAKLEYKSKEQIELSRSCSLPA